MNVEDQRKLGVRIATEADAPKTLAAVKDVNSCFDTILKTAADEIGLDKLTSILNENEPEWAFQALINLPDLGDKRDALVANAGEFSSNFIKPATLAETEEISGTVSGLSLYLATGCSYSGAFTLLWQDRSGNVQPQTAYPNAGDWKWSQYLSISVNRQGYLYGTDCKLPNAPISPGDTLWMLVGPSGSANGSYDTGFRFKYDPNAGTIRIDTTGGADNPNFTLHNSSAAA